MNDLAEHDVRSSDANPDNELSTDVNALQDEIRQLRFERDKLLEQHLHVQQAYLETEDAYSAQVEEVQKLELALKKQQQNLKKKDAEINLEEVMDMLQETQQQLEDAKHQLQIRDKELRRAKAERDALESLTQQDIDNESEADASENHDAPLPEDDDFQEELAEILAAAEESEARAYQLEEANKYLTDENIQKEDYISKLEAEIAKLSAQRAKADTTVSSLAEELAFMPASKPQKAQISTTNPDSNPFQQPAQSVDHSESEKDINRQVLERQKKVEETRMKDIDAQMENLRKEVETERQKRLEVQAELETARQNSQAIEKAIAIKEEEIRWYSSLASLSKSEKEELTKKQNELSELRNQANEQLAEVQMKLKQKKKMKPGQRVSKSKAKRVSSADFDASNPFATPPPKLKKSASKPTRDETVNLKIRPDHPLVLRLHSVFPYFGTEKIKVVLAAHNGNGREAARYLRAFAQQHGLSPVLVRSNKMKRETSTLKPKNTSNPFASSTQTSNDKAGVKSESSGTSQVPLESQPTKDCSTPPPPPSSASSAIQAAKASIMADSWKPKDDRSVIKVKPTSSPTSPTLTSVKHISLEAESSLHQESTTDPDSSGGTWASPMEPALNTTADSDTTEASSNPSDSSDSSIPSKTLPPGHVQCPQCDEVFQPPENAVRIRCTVCGYRLTDRDIPDSFKMTTVTNTTDKWSPSPQKQAEKNGPAVNAMTSSLRWSNGSGIISLPSDERVFNVEVEENDDARALGLGTKWHKTCLLKCGPTLIQIISKDKFAPAVVWPLPCIKHLNSVDDILSIRGFVGRASRSMIVSIQSDEATAMFLHIRDLIDQYEARKAGKSIDEMKSKKLGKDRLDSINDDILEVLHVSSEFNLILAKETKTNDAMLRSLDLAAYRHVVAQGGPETLATMKRIKKKIPKKSGLFKKRKAAPLDFENTGYDPGFSQTITSTVTSTTTTVSHEGPSGTKGNSSFQIIYH